MNKVYMDNLRFIRLWDTYRGLLTPTQQEICDLYFNLDLTLSEIADEKGITRQGVSECLKTSKKQLEEYESKLHIIGKLEEIAGKVGEWAENFTSAHPAYSEDIGELLKILDK